MENNNADKLAEFMLSRSRVELDNPDFTLELMSRIKSENRKRTRIRQGGLYLVLFLLIDALIYAWLKLLDISIIELSNSISSATREIASTSHQDGYWLVIYFLIQAVLMGVMIGVVRSRLGSRL